MSRRLITTGSPIEAGFACSRTVVQGEWCSTKAERAAFGEVRPAGTVVVAGRINPKMRVEIEVTALRQPA